MENGSGWKQIGPRLQRLEGGKGFFTLGVLTCFLFHQPDICWLWPLQLVYGKTDLEK